MHVVIIIVLRKQLGRVVLVLTTVRSSIFGNYYLRHSFISRKSIPNLIMPRKQKPKEWEIWEAREVPFSRGDGEKDRPVIIRRIDVRTGIYYCFPVTSQPPGNYGKYTIKDNKGTGFKKDIEHYVMYDLVELRRRDLSCRRGSLAEIDRKELLKQYNRMKGIKEVETEGLAIVTKVDYSSMYSQSDVDRRAGRALNRGR